MRSARANVINLTNSFQGLCCEGDHCDTPCSHDLETKIDDGPPALEDSCTDYDNVKFYMIEKKADISDDSDDDDEDDHKAHLQFWDMLK